jgi:hypothetical protein
MRAAEGGPASPWRGVTATLQPIEADRLLARPARR